MLWRLGMMPSPFFYCRLRGLEDRLHRDDLAERRVVRASQTAERIERLGVDLAALHQAVAEMKRHHFADNQAAARLAELEALAQAAFHRDRRYRNARRFHQQARFGREP